MPPTKYKSQWVGIDGGREGLWREPIWTDVLRIISRHEGEHVYDPESSIYSELLTAYPHEKWRSETSDGRFRPLFRDYPHPWTRTGVVNLVSREFRTTELGRKLIRSKVSKSWVLLRMLQSHEEATGPRGELEKPFSIVASAFLAAPRPLENKEVYWCVMKNYRPGADDLTEVIAKASRKPVTSEPEPTPYRRLKNMLSLMRAVDALSSTRRKTGTVWSAFDRSLLTRIADN